VRLTVPALTAVEMLNETCSADGAWARSVHKTGCWQRLQSERNSTGASETAAASRRTQLLGNSGLHFCGSVGLQPQRQQTIARYKTRRAYL